MRNVATRMRGRLRQSRIIVYGIAMPLALTLMAPIEGVARIAIVVLGFSLIIFLHELGHFAVARACSVKCLAFSLGIGPRMLGWRKGAGVTFGPDPYDPDVKEKQNAKKGHKVEQVESTMVHSDLPTSADEPPHSQMTGVTDYRLSWLPLGGYVRMLGQDDMDPTKVSNDPRAFNQRPIWQRMCVISAGVIMNLIFAAVVFFIIFSPAVGVDFPPGKIGSVIYDSPAWKGGLRMGDTVVGIDGQKPRRGFLEFTDIKLAAALSSGDRKVEFDYQRPGVAGEEKAFIQPTPGDDGLLSIGVGQMPSLKVVPSRSTLDEEVRQREQSVKDGGLGQPETAREIKKLRPRDEILTVDGKPVANYTEMYAAVQAAGPRPLALTLKNPNPKLSEVTITLTPELLTEPGVQDFPNIFGIGPELVAQQVGEKSAAAKARMEPGDVIVAIGERQHPTMSEFRSIARESAGMTLKIVVRRGTRILPLDVAVQKVKGYGQVGILPGYALDDMSTVVRDPSAPGLPAGLQSLPETARLAQVDGKPVSSWGEFVWMVQRKKPGETITLTFDAPAAAPVTGTFTLSEPLLATLHDQTLFRLNVPVEFVTRTQMATSAPGAMMMGLDHTQRFAEQVYMTLVGLLVRRTVPPSSLHGIVGIGYVGYEVQERGMAWFWYLMGIVSVNLAVINFLPLPIVDGGLFLLLIVEKIRGKPLSLKVQSAIQVVGIVLLAGLFLYVTVNDVGLFFK